MSAPPCGTFGCWRGTTPSPTGAFTRLARAWVKRSARRSGRLFFGSIHGTLNHVLVGDRIWLARFGGEEVPSTGLDTVLYEDFDELLRAREHEDERIEAFASGLTEGFLGGTIRYVNKAGRTYEDPIHLLVAHLFNDQTHHRGQIHDLLTQTDVPPPVLDMHRVIKPNPEDRQAEGLTGP